MKCAVFFANDEAALRKFIKFYNHYNDFTNYETIFEEEYGKIYRAYKGMQKPRVYNEPIREGQSDVMNNADYNKIYDRMCKYLEDDEKDLAEFKEFYKENKDSANLEKLLQCTYGGDIYVKLGITTAPKNTTFTPVLDFHNDIKIIRRWIQFFGWVTIIGIVISVISGIVIGLS